MKYFTVEKETMNVAPIIYPVNASGEQSADAWESDFVQEIATGFCVNELGEDGRTEEVNFYPIQTNTRDFTNNEEEVLGQIKKDYPPTEWQNNEW